MKCEKLSINNTMKAIVTFLTFLFLVASCTQKNDLSAIKQPSNLFKYAKWFDIKQKNGYKILTIINPKTQKKEQEFYLVNGDNNSKLPISADVIQVPVKNIAALSISFIGAYQTLNSLNVIKAASSKQFIYNKKIIQGIENKSIIQVDYESGLSAESALSAEIELILFNGFGQPYPNEEKLKKLGLQCMSIYDWEETSPLGKAEWIKVFGALVGKSDVANEYFNQIEKEYFEIKRKSKMIHSKLKVISGSLVGDVWYTPAGESFFALMLRDAGFSYIYKDSKGSGSLSLSLEQVMKDEQKCDVWINAEALNRTQLENLNPKFKYFHTVNNGKVYSYMHNSNYFWEYSQVNPNWLLKDLFIIASGDTVSNMHFYKQINK